MLARMADDGRLFGPIVVDYYRPVKDTKPGLGGDYMGKDMPLNYSTDLFIIQLFISFPCYCKI